MSNIVFGIICGILEFIVFLFLVVSIPSDILRSKVKPSWPGTSSRQCFSFWGTKRCGPHKHNPYGAPLKGFPTTRIRNTVNAAAAFDIVGMVTSLVCFIMCLVMACRCCGAALPLVFAVLTVVFVIVSIGCLLGVWYTKLYGTKESRLTKLYDLGFGTCLIVAAWCLQVVILILLIIAACCCSGGSKKKDEEENSGSGEGSGKRAPDDDHSEL